MKGRVLTDHPHGRGENIPMMTLVVNDPGPSPRAWGKRATRADLNTQSRTIPTGVGKTRRQASTTPTSSDHPHGRGENLASFNHCSVIPGPSPRAWGKRSWLGSWR